MSGKDFGDSPSSDQVLASPPRPGGDRVSKEDPDTTRSHRRSVYREMSASAPTSPADFVAPPPPPGGVGNRSSTVSIVVTDASTTESATAQRAPVADTTPTTAAAAAASTGKPDKETAANHSSSTIKLPPPFGGDRGVSKSMSRITASLTGGGEKKNFLKRSKSEAIQNQDHKVKKSKQRNSQLEKFYRVFGDMNETLVNSYHCALLGDIMIQGILYVTEHWLLFYSKLLGKKSIKIAVSEIVDISKKKTAGLIPNAICIDTGTKKYIFGSLMNRDSTLALLCDIWKGVHPTETTAEATGTENTSNHSVAEQGHTPDNTSDNESNTSIISSDLENATQLTSNGSEVFYTDSPRLQDNPSSPSSTSTVSTRRPHSSPQVAFSTAGDLPADDVTDGPINSKIRSATSGSRDQAATQRQQQQQQQQQLQRGSAAAVERVRHSTGASSRSTTNVRSACIMMLVISFTLALVLTFATVILVYKIVRLQMIVEHGLLEHASFSYASTRARSQTHAMSQLEELLESHKQLLQQVNQSLNGLTEMTRGVCSSLQKPET